MSSKRKRFLIFAKNYLINQRNFITMKLYWLIGLSLVMLASCGDKNQIPEDLVEAFPVKIDQSDKWSLVDLDGDLIYEDEFENQPSGVFEEHFAVKEGSYYVLYHVDGKRPQLVKGCDKLTSVGIMNGGLIPVTKPDKRISVINDDGETVFELKPYKGHEIVECDYMFRNELLKVVTDEGKIGFVDEEGNMVIKPIYKSAGSFNHDLCMVQKDEDSNIIVINTKGETVIKFKDNWTPYCEYFYEDYFVVRDDNDRFIFIDEDGDTKKCPSKVDKIAMYNEDYIVFLDANKEKWGVMKMKDFEVIVRPKYDYISIYDDDKFICHEEDGACDILNDDGEREFSIDDFSEGVGYVPYIGLVGCNKNSFEVLDDDGKPKKNQEYAQIGGLVLCYTVKSDYFDFGGIAAVMKDILKPAGFDGFVLGQSAKYMLPGQPSDYRYTSSYEIPAGTGSGKDFSYTTIAKFDSYVSSYNYQYDYYTWNNYSDMVSLELNINTDFNLTESAFNKAVRILNDLGYDTEYSNYWSSAGEAELYSGNVKAQLAVNEYGSITITLSRGSSYQNATQAVTEAAQAVEAAAQAAVANDVIEDWDDLYSVYNQALADSVAAYY